MEIMYPPQNNGPHTILAGDINSADTSVTVGDGSILPPAPNVLTIGLGEDAELVLMKAKTGNILTIERGFNQTKAKAWGAGDWIYRAITAQDIGALQGWVQEHSERLVIKIYTLTLFAGAWTQSGDIWVQEVNSPIFVAADYLYRPFPTPGQLYAVGDIGGINFIEPVLDGKAVFQCRQQPDMDITIRIERAAMREEDA